MRNELEFENAVSNLLATIGYGKKDVSEFLCSRNGQELIDVALLEDVIRKINSDITDAHLHEIVAKIKKVGDADLIIGNQKAMEYLQHGVKVECQLLKRTITYKIVDFDAMENNKFEYINQLSIQSRNPNFNNQRPDIIIYLNGLPVSVIELKSEKLDSLDSMNDAFNQIKNYQEYIKNLFF